jgi:hypothetical protein
MSQLDSVNTEQLLEEILNSANALKEATVTQKHILDTVTLSQLDRILAHKDLLIEKIRSLTRELKHRGLDFTDVNGRGATTQTLLNNHEGRDNGNGRWSPQVNAKKKIVERTIRDILTIEADSQRILLGLKQHVRGILLDIQNRRKMLRGYAVPTCRDRLSRVLDTKT